MNVFPLTLAVSGLERHLREIGSSIASRFPVFCCPRLEQRSQCVTVFHFSLVYMFLNIPRISNVQRQSSLTNMALAVLKMLIATKPTTMNGWMLQLTNAHCISPMRIHSFTGSQLTQLIRFMSFYSKNVTNNDVNNLQNVEAILHWCTPLKLILSLSCGLFTLLTVTRAWCSQSCASKQSARMPIVVYFYQLKVCIK